MAKYALSGPNLAHNERNRAGPRLAWIVLERDPDHRRCFRSGSLAASDPEGSDTLNPDQHTGWAPTMLRSDQSVNDR